LSAGLLRNSFKGAASAAPFFPTLLDQMPNAILVFEAENQQLVYVNPAAEAATMIFPREARVLTIT